MESLYDKITKKSGFIYKVKCDENVKYFYLGGMIFKECESDDDICKYNEFLKACTQKQDELIKKCYNNIISNSQLKTKFDVNFESKINKFIHKLDRDQYEDLRKQVDLVSNLFKTCRNCII